MSDQEHESSAWQTRLALLRIANEENVFTGKHAPSQMTMHKALESVLGALSDGWNGWDFVSLSLDLSHSNTPRRSFAAHDPGCSVPFYDYSHRSGSGFPHFIKNPFSTSSG